MNLSENDLALNIRQETRDLAIDFWYRRWLNAREQTWSPYAEEGLREFLSEFLELGTPTSLEAQLIGLHLWAQEQENATMPGDIAAVLANIGYCRMQQPDLIDDPENPRAYSKPMRYYQPLSGRKGDVLLWFDRRWGPVYDVQREAAYKLGDDPLF